MSTSHVNAAYNEPPTGSKSFIVCRRSNENLEKMQHTFSAAAVRILSSTSSMFTHDLDTDTDEDLEMKSGKTNSFSNSFSSSDYEDERQSHTSFGNSTNDETSNT